MFPTSALALCSYDSGTVVCTQDDESDEFYRSSDSCIDVISSTTIIYTSSTRSTYERWSNVNIPDGATITSAKITVYPNAGVGGSTVTATLLDYDDCSDLSLCSSLAETATTADHTIAASWATAVTGDSSYDITGMEDVVQGWINRLGYGYDQALGIRLSGVGTNHTIDGFSVAVIPNTLTITFTGGDPVLGVHMSAPEVHATQMLHCICYNADPTDKLVVKLDGSTVYNQSIGGLGEEVVVNVPVDYAALTAGSHSIDAYIVNSSDVEYTSSHFDNDWTTLHDGYPTVGLDKYNNLCVKNG